MSRRQVAVNVTCVLIVQQLGDCDRTEQLAGIRGRSQQVTKVVRAVDATTDAAYEIALTRARRTEEESVLLCEDRSEQPVDYMLALKS